MAIGKPTGPIKANAPWGGAYGASWEDVNRWDAAVEAACAEFAAPAERVKAHIVIESQGNPAAHQRNRTNGDSWGLLQIVPHGVGWAGWADLVFKLAGKRGDAARMLVDDPVLNVRVGTAILRQLRDQHNDWGKASSAFFLGNPDWKGADSVNGNTGKSYERGLDDLMTEILGKTDPLTLIAKVPFTVTYGWLADVGLAYYDYGVGHGTTKKTQHTGIDLPIPYDTPLYAPFAGTVLCVGNEGSPCWGQACGAYNDYGDGASGQVKGIGNVTVLLDATYNGSPLKLTLGHCRTPKVKVGQKVAVGQMLATSGGMNGPHCHVETAIQQNGTYWLVDPRLALANAKAGSAPVLGRTVKPAKYQQRIIQNNTAWDNLGVRQIKGVCLHRMIGTLWGTDGWFRGGGSGTGLTDYGVGPDGTVLQWNLLSSQRAPWASGPWTGGEGDGPAFVRKFGVNAINRDLASIEIDGNYDTPVSAEMAEAIAQLIAYVCDQWGIAWSSQWPINPKTGLTAVYWHREFTWPNKPCPGQVVMDLTDRIVLRAGEIMKKAQYG